MTGFDFHSGAFFVSGGKLPDFFFFVTGRISWGWIGCLGVVSPKI
jgi:hypothetical protein